MITEETKLQDCDLSIYIKKKLIRAKIETVKDLLKLSITELIKFRGLGKKSAKDIFNFVNSNGFYFNN